ncbi:aminoacyl-histidine dipeptidase [Leeuwenhoekiella nanhaiensis]|uniref:Cytosol non-specific dipeptidase n=1 Tax=Leeuwenhoekiella nanhaiensis TaxID=1655491 RepID=A0A2G1VQJ2_9FLAO|nr:aminoacyl-histidine dipeptidase [Leeuwenhoekiella nanhaiensis]PHQ29031.1 cytosol nonspecific dipeptidase [Leeuwenhoekiella nanhaiensis]
MTNADIRQLEPQPVWKNFADLNAVPRPSKHEEQVIAFMKAFGERLNLETFVDEVGNVIISKPATKGLEDRKMVTLQSHLDMVHQKNKETQFDFASEGIQMKIDGDWVKAEGTTLGADNGLGVATIMALLESTAIPHPALEALFTIDEETGMTGAMGLKPGVLKGEILLNLDTEEDDEIGVGCAGGVDITATRSYKQEDTEPGKTGYRLTVNGLQGGHSGMDIIKGLGNANKLLNRFLLDGFENYGLRLSEIDGGGLRNAIPRESTAVFCIDSIHTEAFEADVAELAEAIKAEYKNLEPNLKITLEPTTLPEKVMELGVQEALIKAIHAAWNGVYRMSPDIKDLVETSNNVARVRAGGGELEVLCLTRSSVESSRTDLANTVRSVFELIGCEVLFSGEYPGWKPNMESPILKVLVDHYEKLNAEKPHVAACHAGLECGILGQNYPEMDMISFGPTIRGAHSPDERVSISSVQKFWTFIQEILKDIPKS